MYKKIFDKNKLSRKKRLKDIIHFVILKKTNPLRRNNCQTSIIIQLLLPSSIHTTIQINIYQLRSALTNGKPRKRQRSTKNPVKITYPVKQCSTMEITSDRICVWVDGTIEPGIESASIYSEVSLADLHVYAYHDTRERERDCHGPPPMPTFHDTRALASGFSLSLSDLTDLLANRMPFTVFTSVSVYSLVGYRIRIRCDFYVHGKYQLVSCRSLFITGICDRACNVVRYFSLSRENF